MTTVITAPESVDVPGYRVFLAGAIDMGEAEDWQAKVIASLSDIPGLVLLNPRRAKFTADTLHEQIQWELRALEQADMIFMWIPAPAKAPVSMFEAGLYLKSGKLLLGAGHGFYRRTNLELTALRYGVPLYDHLLEQVNVLLHIIDDRQQKGLW